MLQEVKQFRGLDLRNSDITRDPSFATDVLNVEKDSRGRLRTRFGYEEKYDLPDNTLDLIRYNKENELIAFTSNGLFKLVGEEFVSIPYGGLGELPVWTLVPSTVEYKGVLYFADPAGIIPLFKYDGASYYRAGVPRAMVTTEESSSAIDLPSGVSSLITVLRSNIEQYFLTQWRFILKHTDNQGNVTYGDYFDIDLHNAFDDDAATRKKLTFDIGLETSQYFPKVILGLEISGITENSITIEDTSDLLTVGESIVFKSFSFRKTYSTIGTTTTYFIHDEAVTSDRPPSGRVLSSTINSFVSLVNGVQAALDRESAFLTQAIAGDPAYIGSIPDNLGPNPTIVTRSLNIIFSGERRDDGYDYIIVEYPTESGKYLYPSSPFSTHITGTDSRSEGSISRDFLTMEIRSQDRGDFNSLNAGDSVDVDFVSFRINYNIIASRTITRRRYVEVDFERDNPFDEISSSVYENPKDYLEKLLLVLVEGDKEDLLLYRETINSETGESPPENFGLDLTYTSLSARVISINGNNVVLSYEQNDDERYLIPYEVGGNWEYIVAGSVRQPVTGGFLRQWFVSPDLPDYLNDPSEKTGRENYVPLLDIYDYQSRKLLPPFMRYITLHNNIMVGGNAVNAEERTSASDDDVTTDQTIYWSNNFLGSSVETFTADDNESIGESGESSISGLYSEQNNLVVFKERQIYVLSGVLPFRQFRINKIQTNEIGCISHRSIHEISGGVIFMSERGVHMLNPRGQETEISNMIEPLFIDNPDNIDWRTVNTVHILKDEKFYFITENQILVYDYYHKDWFLFKGIPASQGMLTFDGEVLHAGNDKVYNRSAKLRDLGKRIPSYYDTGWFHGRSPMLAKTFLRAVLLGAGNWRYAISTFRNWGGKIRGIPEGKITDAQPLKNISIPKEGETYSVKFKIESKGGDGILLNGMGVEYQGGQKSPQGAPGGGASE